MTWQRAPLYVRSYDLCVWLYQRATGFSVPSALGLARTARGLLESIALALTFPVARRRHQRRADEHLVRLRTLVTLAEEFALLSPRQRRYVAAELDAIGRMLGGWRQATDARHRRRERAPDRSIGAEAHAAPAASSAAAASGTTPTGRAPRTETGGTRGTAGTTSASASCCPPPSPDDALTM